MPKLIKLLPLLCFCYLGLAKAGSLPATLSEQINYLQQQWAEIKYQHPEAGREAELESLSHQAHEWRLAAPDNAELLIWEGIITSTLAGESGGLSALRQVGEAKELFEQALAIDDQALAGSAYTSLGVLYYQVPGWPLSFGSDKKARILLKKGLSVNPDGIDSNYFYGEFLLDQNQSEAARKVLQHALAAPPRPDRPLADKGRRAEIEALLQRLDQPS